jgi:DNA-binding transcriptional LysR family regulator
MDRDLLGHLPVVISVARHRGFAPAAAALGMSPSAVSHAVRTVEDRLGQPLFARTTRSVSLTEAGSRFLASVGSALDDIAKAAEGLAADRGDVTGLLRINAPYVALPMALTPILARLAKQHPRMTVEMYANDAFVDIVTEGFDAGIRVGKALQQDMIALRLTPPFKSLLVASKTYVESNGAPKSIDHLHSHNCIGYRLAGSGGIYEWELNDRGKLVTIKTSGTVLVTDVVHARDLALAGVGIAYLPEPIVRRDIREGRLKPLLPQSTTDEDGLFLYYPRRASLAPKLRAFIDVARATFAR